ncbi:cytochrome oxidase putative small subunit CydP [Legionella nagasakiensis]|uniref:cytochrome oxidase putative small subunit CydP n=1 Tax=Legionella nagasakiensis TaxID=535290 RepID=UPI00105613C2|nr:cytochrome oxidase putative small subunit CydP [Legionella nagasakiensis]
MTPFRRDILITLAVKLSLLVMLWFVCFKDVDRPAKNIHQWLLGTSLSSVTAHNPFKSEY